MIARDISDTLGELADEHESHSSREILTRMGIPIEEVEDAVAIMVDRAAQITRRDEGPLDAAAKGWVDGFMCGVAIERRRQPTLGGADG